MSERPSGFVVGWTTFAGLMMILIGGFHAMAGVIAILDDAFYTTPREYVFQFDASTWGWIHLILGTWSFSLVSHSSRGRVGSDRRRDHGGDKRFVGFAWLPWYPVWGIVIIAIAVSVVWALTVHGRDLTDVERHGTDVARNR